MILSLLTGLALAGTPCELPSLPDVLEGENFWVEWEPSVGDAQIAQDTLDWSEEARRVYTEELGYDFPDATVLITLQKSDSGGGLTTTVQCDNGVIAPKITLFARELGEPGENTTKHEVVHAVQYAYMGSYIDSILSWPWWMEGHATWLTWHADGNDPQQFGPARHYVENPWLGLHQTQLAYADPVASRFLYGTVVIAQHIERNYGTDAIRATWEYGGPLAGNPIHFPDAIEAAGLDFEDFWRGFQAETVVLDFPDAPVFFAESPAVAKRLSDLPAEGSPNEDKLPGGLALSILHVRSVTGAPGRDLVIDVEADPTVSWIGTLVRAEGKGPGDAVVDTVALELDGDGTGSVRLTEFDGEHDAFLVMSPVSQELTPFDWSWSARLEDPNAREEEPGGCGCSSTPGSAAVLAWLPLILLVRRRD